MNRLFTVILFLITTLSAVSQTTVKVDATATPIPISKFIYGRNNSLSGNPGDAFVPEWTKLKDAGVTMFRESGGNNCTKYNYRRKISSHPDWYNNIYSNDWDFAATSLQEQIPSASGMWAFQLLGKAAKNDKSNFNDWGYNTSKWWNGVNQNLAGGGTPNPANWTSVTDPANASAKTDKPGDPDLYLEDWTADSTTSILDHWFNDLSLKKENFKYWNMDNEVEIWSGTHDDVMPTQLPAEDFMQKYFTVAKKARERYPDIKLVGPVTANEWQWYNWDGNPINVDGKYYPWIEYFIKRVSEEQATSKVKLLDVLDLHFYPGSSKVSDVVQMHRVYFDKDYVFPEANGVKKINGSYDGTQTKEYIFERIKGWLDQYLGAGHGVTLGVTETGVNITDANGVAVWYAGTLGEFMKHPEVEIFTPWTWKVGMWETLHLFRRYNQPSFIPSVSSDELNVSGYSSINDAGDSITIMLVNRASSAKKVNVSFQGFNLASGADFEVRKLSGLGTTETFNSHTSNALQKSTMKATDNVLSVSMPALSVMSLRVKGAKGNVITGTENGVDLRLLEAFPNPTLSDKKLHIKINESGRADLDLIEMNGRVNQSIFKGTIQTVPFEKDVDVSTLNKGMYILRLKMNGKTVTKKVITF